MDSVEGQPLSQRFGGAGPTIVVVLVHGIIVLIVVLIVVRELIVGRHVGRRGRAWVEEMSGESKVLVSSVTLRSGGSHDMRHPRGFRHSDRPLFFDLPFLESPFDGPTPLGTLVSCIKQEGHGASLYTICLYFSVHGYRQESTVRALLVK